MRNGVDAQFADQRRQGPVALHAPGGGRKNGGAAVGQFPPGLVEHGHRTVRQRHAALESVLHALGGNGPNRAREIDVVPGGLADLEGRVLDHIAVSRSETVGMAARGLI